MCDWIECLVSSMPVRRCTSVYIFFCQIVIYQFPSIMSRCFLSKNWHPYTDTQALKHTQTHTSLLLFILQNLTAWYYCHANLRRLSPQMQSYSFYIQTHTRLTLGTLKKRAGGGWGGMLTEQTTNATNGISISFNLLESLRSALCCNMPLPWLTRSVSFMLQTLFTSVIPCIQDNP